MSVFIKGMDMPKDGKSKVYVLDPDGTFNAIELIAFNDRRVVPIGKAIEIPTPHGRLLNLRDIAELACRTKDRMTLRQLSDLPTFIEAEE